MPCIRQLDGKIKDYLSCGGINTNAKSASGMGSSVLEIMSTMFSLVSITRNMSGQLGTLLLSAKSATMLCMTGTRTSYQLRANNSNGGSWRSMEWMTGFPDKPGWYDCKVNGVECRLCFRYCPSCGMYVWQNMDGIKVQSEVLWLTESHSIYP